jgi:hypothetical protein
MNISIAGTAEIQQPNNNIRKSRLREDKRALPIQMEH